MELRDRNYILIDAETTGFDCKKNRLLEVGILVLKDFKIVKELEYKIKVTDGEINEKAMESNKINIEEHNKIAIDSVEAAGNIINDLRECIGQDPEDKFIVIGQNVSFDIQFLNNLFFTTKKYKEYREVISYRTLDLMQLALIKNIEGKISLEKQDLDSILNELDIEIPENRHRALADCHLEYEAFINLLKL